MKNTAIKLFGLAFFAGLIFTTSLWARQIVTQEDRDWAKDTIAREKELGASVSPNTIAVINFNNLTDLNELKPVEKGMAIMLITDLSKLKRYQTVERARMQALIDELHITGQAFADPGAETRMGILLGAEHVVGGDILMQKLNEFKLDSDLLDVPTESITGKPQAQGKLLTELFKMEKDLLFEIIRELEIELTPEEEEDLKKPITDNLQAFLHLIEGIEYSDKGNNQEALKSFDFAILEDPELKLAYSLKDEIHNKAGDGDAEAYSPPNGGTTGTAADLPVPDIQRPEDYINPDYDRHVDQDDDGYIDNLDCNDNNPGINPGMDDSNCNGIDENCSGVPDDGYVSTPTTCGIGACVAMGFTSCVNGAIVDSCLPGTPTEEVCDGADNDCDGSTDGLTRETSCGEGECVAMGFETCTAGTWGNDTCLPGSPTKEVCDSKDNDCDGIVDGLTRETSCGVGECDANGYETCTAGTWGDDTCLPGTPKDEVCDNIDNDCDGTIDGLTRETSCGVGECDANGYETCATGKWGNDTCAPGEPSYEVCDGMDNDCDYQTDEYCDLIPPLVSEDSINLAHRNMWYDSVLRRSVWESRFRPGSFSIDSDDTPYSELTSPFDYWWTDDVLPPGANFYVIDGEDYNLLGLDTVGSLSAGQHSLGLQTVGRELKSDVTEMLPEGVLDQINNNPFLAYAVQVEEDRLNRTILNIYRIAANDKVYGNVDLYNDITEVMRYASNGNDIRARDAFLLQKADAQAGRVLRDREGNLVRTQQYILRPSETSVQMISVSLRGSGPNAGLTSIDWRTNFEDPIPTDLDLRYLDWDDWLRTSYGEGYRYVNNYRPESLSSMSIKFATNTSSINHVRSFGPLEDGIYYQVIEGESLELQGVSPYDDIYEYVNPWSNDPTEGEFYVENFDTVDGAINQENDTSPTGFSYYGVKDGQEHELLSAWFYVLGDYYDEPPPADVNFIGEGGPFGFYDIWDVMMVNYAGLYIGSNNLEIAFFAPGTSPIEDDNAVIDAVYIPMSQMVWNMDRTD